MQYHIQTTPIVDAFKQPCGCAFCRIEAETEARFVAQYQNEAVMEPAYRVRVNKIGFCKNHLAALFSGKNKLGAALQINTHTAEIIDGLSLIYTPKAAKKTADKLNAAQSSCVICDEVRTIMRRYAETTAQMFRYERGFPEALESSDGFCLPHYALLLTYATYAGPATKQYLAVLSKTQITKMKRDNEALEKFTERYDYNSKEKFSSTTDGALKRSVERLAGTITEE